MTDTNALGGPTEMAVPSIERFDPYVHGRRPSNPAACLVEI